MLLIAKGLRAWTVARAVGWVTFLEIIRDKILYNIVLCALLMLGISFLASRVSFVRPERIILDFGLSSLSISCALISTFMGASVVLKEFDRRTLYVALCHPITRFQFVLGKFLGLLMVVILNWFLLGSIYLFILALSSPSPTECFSMVLFAGLSLILLQSGVLAGIAILFSTFSTTSLAAICTIGLFLVGNNNTQIRMVATRVHSSVGNFALRALADLLPNFEYFNYGLKVTYGMPVSLRAFGLSVLYGLTLIVVFLGLAGLLIQSREV